MHCSTLLCFPSSVAVLEWGIATRSPLLATAPRLTARGGCTGACHRWDRLAGWVSGAEVVGCEVESAVGAVAGVIAFRDPFVRRENGGWRMFVGAALNDGTAAALTYRSADLTAWTYDGIALARHAREREPLWVGALWECPQLFVQGERAALLWSAWADDVAYYPAYAVGRYADARFDAAQWGRLAYGDCHYAPSLFFDADDAPCLLFWLRGIADPSEGWAGAHSIPYRVGIANDRVVLEPHADVARHRGARALDGKVDSAAVDVDWQGAGELTISSRGRVFVRLRRQGQAVSVIADATIGEVPVAGAVRVILDGPILEICSEGGLFGAPRTTECTEVTVDGESFAAFPLSR